MGLPTEYQTPKLWKSCKVITYYDHDTCSHDTCDVKLDRNLLIEYLDEGQIISYRGPNDGSGHFLLKSGDVGGSATLHLNPEHLVLEGSWSEGGYNGMWKIFLGS